MTRFLILFVILAINASSIVGQNNPTELRFDLLQGDSIAFDLTGEFAGPVLNYAPVSGYTSRMPLGGNEYQISYYAPDNFTGEVVFSYKSSFFIFPTVSSEITTVYVDVVKSTNIANDDFIDLSSTETTELYPLLNDSSNTNSLELAGIAQVMHGTAVVTDSNTIIYTPADVDVDYVVYSSIDSLGTSGRATYHITQNIAVLEDQLETYSISNSQSQYLFFGNDTYSLQSDPAFGTVVSVASNVYAYTPHTDSTGVDVFAFIDASGNEKTFEVTVFDSYVDIGMVKDDRFYTAKNTEILFNVFDNDFDNSLVIDEANTSESLVYLGNGQFTYSPEEQFSGVKKFYYTATNGVSSETGNIEIAVSDFVPKDQGTYLFSVLEGSVLSLMYEVPLGGYTFDVLASPSFGTLDVIYGDSLVTDCGLIAGNVALVYTPFAGYEGQDEFDIQYCPDSGSADCELIKTAVTVLANTDIECNCVDECVWAGDANNDGIVNMLDVLTIGRSIGNAGEARQVSDDWAGTEIGDWDGKTIFGTNHKYADTDGDGIVAAADVVPVLANYNKVHSYAENNVLAVKDYPFFIIPQNPSVEPGDLAVFDIIIGTEAYPVVDLQGIAFAINLSADFVDSSSVKLTFLEDKYLVKQSPFLNIVHQPTDGIIHAAGIRTNGNSSSGYGLVATLEFIVEDEIDGVKTPQRIRSAGSSTSFDMDVLISDIVVEDGSGYQFAVADASNSIAIDVEDSNVSEAEDGIEIYPNPASEYIVVSSTSDHESIAIVDLTGKMMYNNTAAVATEMKVDVSTWPSGCYILTLTSSTEVSSHKVQIVR